MLERGTAGDQTREVVELLGVLVDETEGQLQPVAVRLLLESGDGMQIAVQARGFRVFALLKIEHGAVEDLRQHVPTTYDQGSLLERQSLDHALLSATGQPQLPLTATCRLCGRCRFGHRLDQRLRRRRRCGPGRNDFRAIARQCSQRVIGKCCVNARRGAGHQRLQLADLVQGFLYLGQQLLIGERLADEVRNTGLNRLNDVFLVATAGHHDERHVLQAFLLTAPGQQFEP